MSCASLAVASRSTFWQINQTGVAERTKIQSRTHNLKPMECWRHAATKCISVAFFRRTGFLAVGPFVLDGLAEPGQSHLAVLGPWNREDGILHDLDEVDDKRDDACEAVVRRARDQYLLARRNNNGAMTKLRVACRTVLGVVLVWLDVDAMIRLCCVACIIVVM